MKKFFHQITAKTWQKVLLTAAYLVALGLLSVFLLSAIVKGAVKDKIVRDTVPSESGDCIFVLGCGVKADGSPSDMLRDRLLTAIELYRQGVAPEIFLSGDGEKEDYNEIRVMKAFCLDQGVPETDIRTDPYGLSTYNSLYRAGLYGIKRPVIVTQEYHLYRALYIAQSCGLEAVGVPSDLRRYRAQIYRDLREVLARCKDFYATQIWPLPAYTEPVNQ